MSFESEVDLFSFQRFTFVSTIISSFRTNQVFYLQSLNPDIVHNFVKNDTEVKNAFLHYPVGSEVISWFINNEIYTNEIFIRSLAHESVDHLSILNAISKGELNLDLFYYRFTDLVIHPNVSEKFLKTSHRIILYRIKIIYSLITDEEFNDYKQVEKSWNIKDTRSPNPVNLISIMEIFNPDVYDGHEKYDYDIDANGFSFLYVMGNEKRALQLGSNVYKNLMDRCRLLRRAKRPPR